MMTKEQVARLKIGDVVLVCGKPRVIRDLSASADGGRLFITFAIKRRSWTNRIYTVYGYHDLKHALSLPRKPLDATNISKAESELLEANRFEVIEELARELTNANDDEQRGFSVRKEALSLARKAMACALRKARRK